MTETSDEPKQAEAERSRGNGGPGRGPSGAAGSKSKLNGLRGGLRAETYPLPGEEDADAAAQAEWEARYRPASPAARYHAKQCARASVVAERCERFARARIAEQVRRAVRNFRRRGPRRVQRILARVGDDRLGSLHKLAGFSDGCRHLAEILALLSGVVSSRGYLLPGEIDAAVWAHGSGPVLESVATDITAYRLYLLNLGGTPGVDAAELDARLDPASRPAALRDVPRAALLPADPRDCGEQLRGLIQTKCDAYRAEADRHWAEREGPELERMLEEAGFLSDADAKRWQRCHAEQRHAFLRSEVALYQALERDREANEDGNDGPGSAGGAGAGENPEREEKAAAARYAGPAGGTDEDGPGRAFGRPLPGGEGERFLPSETGISPDAPSQRMIQREDPAEEQGAVQGVPIRGPAGAGHDDDHAEPFPPGGGSAGYQGLMLSL